MKIPQNIWHPVLLSRELKRKPVKLRRFGTDFVFWRDDKGSPQAFPDRCPHLGASLSRGSVVNGKLVCSFHGFTFSASGACTHIPANGTKGKIPAGFACARFDCVEVHGFIWLWAGDKPSTGSPAYFAEIEAGFQIADIAIDAKVNYSRAIENQLDSAHLAFVHKTTIGYGGKSFVDGPYVESSDLGLNSWVFNHVDNHGDHTAITELKKISTQRPPSLQLLYPAQWLLNISGKLKNFIAFVPIDENTTRFYLRACHKVKLPIARHIYSALLQLMNRIILQQDLNVITHVTPTFSLDSTTDRFIGADRAIVIYRRWLAGNAAEFTIELSGSGDKIKTIPIIAEDA